jgi:hypothetical protein
MRLYVLRGNRRVYLRTTARSRKELYQKLGKKYFYIAKKRYTIQDVKAEAEKSDTATGLIIGGIIGLIGGPIGVVTGGALGGIIGSSNERTDAKKVKAFNASRV